MDAPEQMPEWQEAHAKHLGAKAEAAAAKDELASLRADNEWLQTQAQLKESFQIKQAAVQLRQQTLTQIKTDFPKVPEVVYKNIQDPQEMVAAAKEVHDEIAKAAPPAAGQSGQTWGTPPAGTQSVSTTTYNNQHDDPNYLKDIRRKAKSGNKEAVSEIKKAAFSQVLDRSDKYSKARKGERV